MISVSSKSWEQKKININNIEKVKQDYNLSNIVAQLVTSRHFDESELTTIKNNLFLNIRIAQNVGCSLMKM